MTRPRRSLLFVPAANPRALEKSLGLSVDTLIFDLEDSVAPEAKEESRERLRAHLAALPDGPAEIVVRVNALQTPEGPEDLFMARGAWRRAGGRPAVDAILLPKVEAAADLLAVEAVLTSTDAPEHLALWAMIETPRGILNAADIAAAGGRLQALVVGPNDIVAATGIQLSPGRPELVPWLSSVVLAAKAYGLLAIDGVFNDFGDAAGLAAECAAGRAMGFDGKTLIHPAQIAAADLAFGPSPDDIGRAEAIVAAFARPEHAGAGVIRLDGRMVELLHRHAAERLLALRDAIARKTR